MRLLAALSLVVALQGDRRVPSANELDRALAQIEISRDGQTVTARDVAPDSLRLCVAQKPGQFGPTRCFLVGQIRRGEVRTR
jgi:hypothetical protein